MTVKLYLDHTSETVLRAKEEYIAAVTAQPANKSLPLIGHTAPVFARPAARYGQGKFTRMNSTTNRFRKTSGK